MNKIIHDVKVICHGCDKLGGANCSHSKPHVFHRIEWNTGISSPCHAKKLRFKSQCNCKPIEKEI